MNPAPNYVPLIINFIPAVKSTTVTPTLIEEIYTEYRLLITNEVSNNSDKFNALPQKYVVTVPSTGVIKLKLLAYDIHFDNRQPVSRYKAEYYTDEGKKIGEQKWRIPSVVIPIRTLEFDYLEGGAGFELPNDLFEITSITPEVQYNVSNNKIVPTVSGNYTLTYQPGLTLNDVFVFE